MRQPRLTFAIVSTGVVLATLDQFIVNIAFPSIEQSLGGSVGTLSWVLNGYSIVFAALLVPAGRLADRSGRKRGFLAGVALFTVASALCAAASSVGLLIAARALQGPVVEGLLVEASWRWVFLVNVPIGIAAFVAGRRYLPSPAPERGPMPDLLGAFWLAGSIGTLSLALVKGEEWGGHPVASSGRCCWPSCSASRSSSGRATTTGPSSSSSSSASAPLPPRPPRRSSTASGSPRCCSRASSGCRTGGAGRRSTRESRSHRGR
jgi:MFS family permease